jgi:hypothetical protein
MSDMSDQMSQSELDALFGPDGPGRTYMTKSSRAFPAGKKPSRKLLDRFFRHQRVALTPGEVSAWMDESDLAWYLTEMYGGFEVIPVEEDGQGVFISVQIDNHTGTYWLCEKLFYPHKAPNGLEIACIVPKGLGHLVGTKVEETEVGLMLSTKGCHEFTLNHDQHWLLASISDENGFSGGRFPTYGWSEKFLADEMEPSGRSQTGLPNERKVVREVLMNACPTALLAKTDYLNALFTQEQPASDDPVNPMGHIRFRAVVGVRATMNKTVPHKTRGTGWAQSGNASSTLQGDDILKFASVPLVQELLNPLGVNGQAVALNLFNPRFRHSHQVTEGTITVARIYGGFRAAMGKAEGISWGR